MFQSLCSNSIRELMITIVVAFVLAVPYPGRDPSTQESPVLFTFTNISDKDICKIFVVPQTQNDNFGNRLKDCQCEIAKGGSFQVQLTPGLYKVQIEGCNGKIFLQRENIPVTAPYEFTLTSADLKAADCFPLLQNGNLFFEREQYEDAEDKLQAALKCYRDIPYRFGEGTVLNNIAAIYGETDRYGEAVDLYHRAEGIAQDLNDLDMQTASLNGLANIYEYQGLYEKGVKELEKALELRRKMMDPQGVSIILNNIGVAYRTLHQYDMALENYEQALKIQRQFGDLTAQATTLANIGFVYQGKKQYRVARDYFDQALVLARQEHLRTVESKILNGMGVVYAFEKRPAEALDSLEQALVISRELKDRSLEAHILTSIADLQKEDSRQYDQAMVNYEDAMSALESVRTRAGSEQARAGYVSQYSSLYQNAVDLYHKMGLDEAAFFTSERGRARSFLDSLSTHSIELSDQDSTRLWEAELNTFKAVQAIQDDLSAAQSLSPPDPQKVANLEASLETAKQEYAAILAEIDAKGNQLAALVPGRSVLPSLAEIQSLLPDDVTLLSYYLLGDNGSLAFIITHQDFQVVELPEAVPEQLATSIAYLRSWPVPFPNPLRDLYDWLVAPVAANAKTPFLGIIPHQALHYVPFAALTDGQTYLGEKFILFELPSASSLPYIQRNAAQPSGSGALVFGDPSSDVPGLPALMNSAAEAWAVASLLNVTPYTGADASETRLRESAAGKAILNLSGHGYYDPGNPLKSVIYLAPDAEKEDGRLEVREIYGLDLTGVRVVVLSACQSHLGELSSGDEMVGLTRAFIYAGAPSVIASLWSVDDEATQALIVSFYKYWINQGMSKGQALQAAQADVRADSRWASPYYWSGFILSGDMGRFSGEPAVEATQLLPATAIATPATVAPPPATSKTLLGLILSIVLLFVIILAAFRTRRRLKRTKLTRDTHN